MKGPFPLDLSATASVAQSHLQLGVMNQGVLTGRLDHWSLERLPDIRDDINDDGIVDTADADLMTLIISRQGADATADLSHDGKVDATDLATWIHDYRHSFLGDVNLDGQFNSQDMIKVFQAGEYEDMIEVNSRWSRGDWNADNEFTSSDLMIAFQDGGYEQGPRPVPVPEPARLLWCGGFVALRLRRRSRSRQASAQNHSQLMLCQY